MKVEIHSDVLCPWCYIGKRRLTAALETVADRHAVELVWRSYELSPEQSRTPGPTAAEAMTEWWGDQAAARVAHIRSLGAAEGLELNLELARPVNTFDAHRLSHFAARRGLGGQMMERLLRAYHTEGLNVADPDVLRRLGGETGLDTGEVGAMLAGDDHAGDVRADRRRAAERGITGVPSLVIDGGPPVAGVQPPADLRRLLELALTASSGRA
ncbi:DsbA family oxidoreductase [Nonomuraea sp. SBT364]|uniref:DsbA family oxidoreductase n=1 Tax=Nonomuraea sp. SBT364 TaxID=1580530 RepID=UPI00066C77D6|nr:DsbA family oxidoreductase [Nonomuraea sp. SBT364]